MTLFIIDLKEQVKTEFSRMKNTKKDVFIQVKDDGYELHFNTSKKDRDGMVGFNVKKAEIKQFQTQPALAEFVAMKAEMEDSK